MYPKMLFGLLGRRLGHSFSAEFFNTKFSRENIDARYELFELSEIDLLPELLDTHPNLCGLNVTVPYKESVIPYLDRLAPEAQEVGAVNVIEFIHEGGRLILRGNNSDVYGFMESFMSLIPPGRGEALVLGTGGASKAAATGLRRLGKRVTFVSRNPLSEDTVRYSELDETRMRSIQVIVNATPLGMWPDIDQAPPIPYRWIHPATACLDLVYNPAETLFLRRCAAQGARVANGELMLRLQAQRAWKIWMGELL